jgi:AraC family transcriptional regulator
VTEGALAPRILEHPGLVVIGLSREYRRSDLSGIPVHWDDLFEYLAEIHFADTSALYGVSDPATGAVPRAQFRYTAGAAVVNPAAPIPDGLTRVEVPAGRYACFLHQGPASVLGETLAAIHRSWLPDSGYRRQGVVDFERYDHRFDGEDPENPESVFEIYLPVVEDGAGS